MAPPVAGGAGHTEGVAAAQGRATAGREGGERPVQPRLVRLQHDALRLLVQPLRSRHTALSVTPLTDGS